MPERETEKDSKTAGNKGRPGRRVQSTDGKHPKDYSFVIVEFIPAWMAVAIHFRTEKEILCGYHDPKVKADHV